MDFYGMCGFDYIKQAFTSAMEAKEMYGLDDLKLYYNDYSLNNPYKRQAAVKLILDLQREGIEIDGIGMQAHYRLSNYLKDKEGFLYEFEESIKTFTSLGIDVQITELDLQVYASSDVPSEFDELPEDVEAKQAEMFSEIYRICRKYSLPWTLGAGVVDNVTTWGIADDHNAHNSTAHKEFPLLFHKDHSPKQAISLITDFKEEE